VPWDDVRELLKLRIPADQFDRWIDPLLYLGDDEQGIATFGVPDTYTAKHIQGNFRDLIRDAIWDCTTKPHSFSFRVMPAFDNREVVNA
jgi:chromosomal replication initiation ATPase DnaA